VTALVNRMVRAAMLDVSLYEEVEADKDAMWQAILVVVLASIASGIASVEQRGLYGLALLSLAALFSWFVWAILTYFIGAKLLPMPQTRSDPGELLRTIGFSSSPGLIRVLGVIPVLHGPVMLIASLWMLATMVVAVRQALDYTSTWRAIGVCLIGWLVQAIALAGIAVLFLGGPERTP